MIRFENDYGEGAHPAVLNALIKSNTEQTPGYGVDAYCDRARATIRKLCEREDIDVHFLVGGTQTNTIAICAALRPHQGVIAATTGHIAVHESGAIEATGHKVLTLPSKDGKITADQVAALVKAHREDVTCEHTVQPAMVYISQPTENGTVYTLSELDALWHRCQALGLFLYVDGARLGYALTAPAADMSLPALSARCDAFYIGGTKMGALFGEALVIANSEMKKDFRYILKQHGGMLAKGRLLGVQFDALLCDGLYFEIGARANAQAQRLRAALEALGIPLRYDSPTNQQFPILPDTVLQKLSEKYAFSFWERIDDSHAAVRFCISWATEDANIDALIEDLRRWMSPTAQEPF
ncbi:MAG: aminotransferase class V-fold PLP-dependent enzyme [Clostridia bacterium]|nr:aminotransferase class V-fold PLP-dependent enzyme [Clostridia bacterium]